MRLLIVLGITCLALLLSACGKGSDASNSTSDSDAGTAGTGSDTDPSSKSIFGVWTEEGNVFSVDLRAAQFGVTSEAYITSGTVGSCTCQVLVQGSQASGTMNFLSCNNGSVGCVELRPSGAYKRLSTSRLQLCSNVSCIYLR
ncbi:hypothetical protein [Bdellovibrio sp. HCB337]|uniref:hypothetical protein n=1 Tax=Bdellovibrio sp. HCB337 TaxID=3394358 RepID=UPI0039A72306